MEQELNLIDLINVAVKNPDGSTFTSKVEYHEDENGNKCWSFKVLA